jgi:hypothetical protein
MIEFAHILVGIAAFAALALALLVPNWHDPLHDRMLGRSIRQGARMHRFRISGSRSH